MVFTLRELFDVVIMTLAVGYIFMDMFRRHPMGFDKKAFWFACLVTAPALIAHELAHKFVALSFGLQAEFHAAYFWLILGVALKLLRFGFIFFVPAYVSIGAAGLAVLPSQSALIAFAGPFLNFVLFAGSWALLKQKRMKRNTFVFLHVTKQINLFLFIFNMLPIPFFDGMKVYQGLFQILF
jgi:Zn-dependent protease